MISRLSVPMDSWLMTSLSANTVQVELISTVLVDWAPGAQVLHLHLQHPGHHVQEPAGAGSTLVVHDKVGHDPVLDLEHLHILAPDVDDGVDFRKKEAGSSGVAAQLAHLLVCDLQHGVATVTCGQDIAHVLPLQPGVLQYVADGPLGAAGSPLPRG